MKINVKVWITFALNVKIAIFSNKIILFQKPMITNTDLSVSYYDHFYNNFPGTFSSSFSKDNPIFPKDIYDRLTESQTKHTAVYGP